MLVRSIPPLGLSTQEGPVPANLCKVLVAVASITLAPSGFANIITDWNENTVTW